MCRSEAAALTLLGGLGQRRRGGVCLGTTLPGALGESLRGVRRARQCVS